MNELVLSSNGKLVTTSLMVAEKFHKRHTHVLDSIKNIINSAEISAQFYVSSTYVDETGRELPLYYMDRDGFTLLAMSFTGKKAVKFKLDYIDAFTRMEASLKVIQQPASQSAAELFFNSAQLHLAQEKKIKEIEDKQTKIQEKIDNIHQIQEDNKKELFNIPLSDEAVKPVELRKQVSMWIKR